MKSSKFLLFVVLLLFCYNNCYSIPKSKLEIINLNVGSGLSSNIVNSIIEDNKGYIWFGTTNGLCRFDGYNFRNYNNEQIMTSNFISNDILYLSKTNGDDIWVATGKELALFDTNTAQIKQLDIFSEISGNIRSLLVVENDNLFIGTDSNLYLYSPKENSLRLITNKYARSLYKDSRGVIWVGTWENGFFTVNSDGSGIVDYNNFCEGKKLKITGFAEDDSGKMWLSTWDYGYLIRLDNPFDNSSTDHKLYEVSDKAGALNNPILYDVVYDKFNENLSVATANGLYVLENFEDDGNFVAFKSDKLGSAEIWDIYLDDEGILWVSSMGAGVNKLIKRDHYFLPVDIVNSKLQQGIVESLYEDKNGVVWIGSRLDILLLWDRVNNKIYSYKDNPILAQIDAVSNTVNSMTLDSHTGNLWLATRYNGIYVVSFNNESKPKSIKHLRDKISEARTINKLRQDVTGKIWIGTESGLYVHDPKIDDYNILPVNAVNQIALGEEIETLMCSKSDSCCYVGTKNLGLFRVFPDGRFDRYSTLNGKLVYDDVQSIYEDKRGVIWVGIQGGGLSYFDKEQDKFICVNSIKAISGNTVYSIIDGCNDNLLIATSRGVVRMLPFSDEKLKLYSEDSGVLNSQFSADVVIQLADSSYLFGGYKGLEAYSDLPISSSDNNMQMGAITEISVMNVVLRQLINEGEVEEEPLTQTQNIYILPSNKNNISFEFSSLSHSSPHANRHAYRLLGENEEWAYTNAVGRNVSYSNLFPGRYTFQMKSCNENSVWSDIREFHIKILPHPALSLWAFIIYFIVLVVIIYITIRILRREINLRNAVKIEKIERIKNEEVNQEKLKFFTNVSHELFTPLSVILCSIESLKEDGNSDSHTLKIMKLNLSRLQRLIQQIMEFRKAESSNLKLKVSRNDIVAFANNLCNDSFSPLLESKEITMNFQTSCDEIFGYFDIDKMDKILYNLLSNALKYNHEKGMVSVSIVDKIVSERRCFVIKVENTGDGIAKSKLPLLFKRFYEGDYRKFNTKGTGIGLSLTKDLVELHQGSIEVESDEGEITTFTVVIPADRESYSEDVIEFEKDDEKESEKLSSCENSNESSREGGELTQVEIVDNRQSVLLVEDDVDLLTVMSKVLSREFIISTAKNGVEALEVLAQKETIDLILTDYIMPLMDGCQLTEAVRNDVNLSHIPIVMLSAKSEEQHYLEGFKSGVNMYISKPVEVAVLIAQIRGFVEHKKMLQLKFSQQEELKTDEIAVLETDKKFIDSLVKIIEENMENSEFSTVELYRIIGMTQSSLYRKLKSIVNMSPNEFIRDIRIKKACELLKRGDLRVSEVAYMVGFSDPKYFSLTFKKERGVSPTKYLESVNS